jgi:hypothetical protein
MYLDNVWFPAALGSRGISVTFHSPPSTSRTLEKELTSRRIQVQDTISQCCGAAGKRLSRFQILYLGE